MSVRRSAAAVVALVAYGYALAVAPLVHQARHDAHGADHVHDGAGLREIVPSPHEAFHADLSALGLDEVATAGTLTVDCGLAALTLFDCKSADAQAHAPRFGDALSHEHAPPPVDPEHGKGSLEHGTALVVGAAPVILPAPAAPHTYAATATAPAPLASLPPSAPSARGPPA